MSFEFESALSPEEVFSRLQERSGHLALLKQGNSEFLSKRERGSGFRLIRAGDFAGSLALFPFRGRVEPGRGGGSTIRGDFVLALWANLVVCLWMLAQFSLVLYKVIRFPPASPGAALFEIVSLVLIAAAALFLVALSRGLGNLFGTNYEVLGFIRQHLLD